LSKYAQFGSGSFLGNTVYVLFCAGGVLLQPCSGNVQAIFNHADMR